MKTVHILLINQVDWSFTKNVLISVKFADIPNIYMYLICGNEIVKKKNPKHLSFSLFFVVVNNSPLWLN